MKITLVSSRETGNLLIVRLLIEPDWFERVFMRYKYSQDEFVFNSATGAQTWWGDVPPEAIREAQEVYYKNYLEYPSETKRSYEKNG